MLIKMVKFKLITGNQFKNFNFFKKIIKYNLYYYVANPTLKMTIK